VAMGPNFASYISILVDVPSLPHGLASANQKTAPPA
jgi:hypothetical protein